MAKRREHGWFSKSDCIEFLGIGRPYFDAEIRPRIPADCIKRLGKARNSPMLLLGRAVYEAAASRKGAVAARAADQEVSGGDPMLSGKDTPQLERYRAASADIKELQRDALQSTLLPRDKVHDGLARLATILRNAGESLQRQHGAEALEIIDEALADFDREMADTFGE